MRINVTDSAHRLDDPVSEQQPLFATVAVNAEGLAAAVSVEEQAPVQTLDGDDVARHHHRQPRGWRQVSERGG